MATYEVTDPKTGVTIELIGDKPPSGDTIRKAFSSLGPVTPKPESKGIMRRGAEAIINSPALPVAGAIGGGLMGAGVGSIPLAGIGAAGGEAFRQIGARALEIPAPQTSTEALKKIGIQGAIGAAGEGAGQLALRALAPIVAPAAKVVGRGIANYGQKLTGIPEESIATAFKKPLAMFTAPSKKTVAAAYGKSEFPQMTRTLDETLEAGTGTAAAKAKRGAKAIKEFVETGTEKPRQIFEARKALDKQISALDVQIDAARGGAKSSLLQDKSAKLEVRQVFNRALDKMAPKLREADALASKNLEVAPFRKAMLPGKINFTSPEGLLRAVPGIPPIIGAGVSAAGGLTKAVTSPLAQKTAAQVGARMVNPVIPPSALTLTIEKAKEFLKKARGNRDKARKLAQEAGYVIPEVGQ